MRRRSHVRAVILLIGGLGVLALVVQGVLAKPLRPAATASSPEEAQLKQLPAPAQQIGRPSKAELLTRCQQRAACRAKLDAAQKGQKPATLRPAASSPSPEELEFKKLPPPATPVTPRRFQRSGLGMWSDGLLAWLNAFRPPLAEAQAAVSVYLTPQNPSVGLPYNYLNLYGVNYYHGGYVLFLGNSTPSASAENRPHVYTRFNAPATGWYIIDVRTSHAAAKLRHQLAGPIIETWDLGSVPCSGGICDYVTTEYLQQGFHIFYFYSPTQSYYFYSVSIESYP